MSKFVLACALIASFAAYAENDCPSKDSLEFKALLFDKAPCNSAIYRVMDDGSIKWQRELSKEEFDLLMKYRTPHMPEEERERISKLHDEHLLNHRLLQNSNK